MVKLYVYDKKTRLYKYSDAGLEDYVLVDIPEGFDFTLAPPPNTHEKWKWIDNKWVADNTAN